MRMSSKFLMVAVVLAPVTCPGIAGAQQAVSGGAAGIAKSATALPRTPDGKVQLGGLWTGRGGGGGGMASRTDAAGNVLLQPPSRDGDLANFEKDQAIEERSSSNKPVYRPEFWDQIQNLDYTGMTIDPVFSCKPAGVPRMGPPEKIVQTPTELIFLYATQNTYRIVPIDGRPRDPQRAVDQTWMGDPLGRWEGDTLVIESEGFNDESWIGWPGYIHSNEMKVVERITRQGNDLHYQATVIDPKTMLEPWVLEPIVRRLNTDPTATILQDLPCEERDSEHIVDKNMRG